LSFATKFVQTQDSPSRAIAHNEKMKILIPCALELSAACLIFKLAFVEMRHCRVLPCG